MHKHKIILLIFPQNNNCGIMSEIETDTPFKEIDTLLLTVINNIFVEQFGQKEFYMLILKHIVKESFDG